MIRAKKHYYKDEIKNLLIIYTLTVLVVSVLIVLIFIYAYSNRVIRENNIKANAEISGLIEEAFLSYTDFLYDERNMENMRLFLRHEKMQKEIFESLYNLNNNTDLKSIFYIVDTKGNTLVSNSYGNLPYDENEVLGSFFFRDLNKSDDIVFTNQKIQVDRTMRTIYSIAKKITYEDEVLGYIIFDIPEKEILNVIHSSSFDIFVLTDSYENGIVTSNQLLLDDIGKLYFANPESEEIEFMDNKYFVHTTSILDDTLFLYTFSKLSIIYYVLKVSLIFIVFFMLIFSVFIFFISEYFARKKTRAVQDLLDVFEEVIKGDLSARVDIRTGDEFEEIGTEFNAILDEFNKQISINEELAERRRIAVIKHLEAQFNPHFIFNTLEILKYLVHIDKEKSIELIVNFANLLRYSINYPDNDVILEEDFQYIENYLMIQKLRYNRRLNYEISIDENLKRAIVPKLILQPIIENCIVHAYNKKMNLNIEIDVTRVEDTLYLSVIDDGDGIDEDELMKLRASLDLEDSRENNFGIRNVHRRIRMMYGENFGMQISSVKDEYTKVVLKIPYKLG